ncbi:MAG: LysE family translocator [Betaproteobacteria bacterium]|nr:LysE family translocator [Betaproteobacteria bacterium]
MPDITLFIIASLLLTIAPGPDIIYVLTRGVTQGRQAGFAAACGFATGVVFHTALAALGIATLIRSTDWAFSLVRYAGAAYLIYIGLRALIAARTGGFTLPSDNARPALWTIYKQSVIGNALNPKVTLFFLSFLPQFINTAAGHIEMQMLLLGSLFMIQTVILFGAVAVFSGWVGNYLRQQPIVAKRLDFFAGLVFIGLGIRVAWPTT